MADITVYRNAFLIYNPAAGGFRGRRRRRLDLALSALEAAGHRVTPAPTPGPGTAGDVAARAIAGGADLVLAAGGDGTINEVLNGMAGSTVPLGILPAGTANVLAHELGIGLGIVRTAARLGGLVPRRVAAGLLRAAGGAPRHFLMMAGIGFDAHIVHSLDLGLKARFGIAAYGIAAIQELGRRLEEFEVDGGGWRSRCSFALASRVRNYGGYFAIARGASLTDDMFEVVLLEGSNPLRYVKYFAGVLTGRLEGMSGVTVRKACRLDLPAPEGPDVYVQVDGEYAGRLPASVEVVPDCITLLEPRE